LRAGTSGEKGYLDRLGRSYNRQSRKAVSSRIQEMKRGRSSLRAFGYIIPLWGEFGKKAGDHDITGMRLSKERRREIR